MSTAHDTRHFVRTPVRTLASVQVSSVGDGEQQVYQAWSDDISPAGIRIGTIEPIQGDEVELKILLPDLAGQVLQGKIVRRESLDEGRMNYAYGIEFTGVAAS